MSGKQAPRDLYDVGEDTYVTEQSGAICIQYLWRKLINDGAGRD